MHNDKEYTATKIPNYFSKCHKRFESPADFYRIQLEQKLNQSLASTNRYNAENDESLEITVIEVPDDIYDDEFKEPSGEKCDENLSFEESDHSDNHGDSDGESDAGVKVELLNKVKF